MAQIPFSSTEVPGAVISGRDDIVDGDLTTVIRLTGEVESGEFLKWQPNEPMSEDQSYTPDVMDPVVEYWSAVKIMGPRLFRGFRLTGDANAKTIVSESNMTVEYTDGLDTFEV